MRTYPNAAKGLSKMFWAKILYIIGVVIAAFFSTVVAIVALVIYLVGLYQTQADDPGFNTAFFLAIIQLVMEFFGVFLGSLGDIISMVLNLAVLYLVCSTTSKLARSIGREDAAQRGHTVWMINIVCTVVGIVLSAAVLLVPALLVAALVISVITAIVSLVGDILYLVFLYKASAALA